MKRFLTALLLPTILTGCDLEDMRLPAEGEIGTSQSESFDFRSHPIGLDPLDRIAEIAVPYNAFMREHDSDQVSDSSKISLTGNCLSNAVTSVEVYHDLKKYLARCREDSGDRLFVTIRLSGPVNHDWPTFLQYALTVYVEDVLTMRRPLPEFDLQVSSPGGDVASALDAGSAVWDLFYGVQPVQPGCFSACVYVLAAAKRKLMADEEAPIGVHSPIEFDPGISTVDQLAASRGAVAAVSREHFSRYGVSPSLVDLMMSIPSTEVKELTWDELKAYGMIGESPILNDLARLAVLRDCGPEFEQRQREYDATVTGRCEEYFTGPTTTEKWNGAELCMRRVATELRVTKRECWAHSMYDPLDE